MTSTNTKLMVFLTAALTICLTGPVIADDNLSPEFHACIDKTGVTVELIDCMQTEYNKLDIRLNSAYNNLMNSLKSEPDKQNQLKEAQRAWLKFRDAFEKFSFDPNGGSAARLSSFQTSLEILSKQVVRLETLTQDY